jgi:glycosyltransferase involved in cell wall biosynthesis
MFAQHYGSAVHAWPTGIDTDVWQPVSNDRKSLDVLIYDKVRWDHDRYAADLIQPILVELRRRGLSFQIIRYGDYRLHEYQVALERARCMLFLCEHETQGFAYQEALSAGVPILAWDRGGVWQDPSYWPERVTFAPVTSVPYWDDRCGVRFTTKSEFLDRLDTFLEGLAEGRFKPRDYILENLTLEKCAHQYVKLAEEALG